MATFSLSAGSCSTAARFCTVGDRKPSLARLRQKGSSVQCTCKPESLTVAAAQHLKKAGIAFLSAVALANAGPVSAELNKYEAEAGGEFGSGSAQQYGAADLRGKDFHGQVKNLPCHGCF